MFVVEVVGSLEELISLKTHLFEPFVTDYGRQVDITFRFVVGDKSASSSPYGFEQGCGSSTKLSAASLSRQVSGGHFDGLVLGDKKGRRRRRRRRRSNFIGSDCDQSSSSNSSGEGRLTVDREASSSESSVCKGVSVRPDKSGPNTFSAREKVRGSIDNGPRDISGSSRQGRQVESFPESARYDSRPTGQKNQVRFGATDNSSRGASLHVLDNRRTKEDTLTPVRDSVAIGYDSRNGFGTRRGKNSPAYRSDNWRGRIRDCGSSAHTFYGGIGSTGCSGGVGQQGMHDSKDTLLTQLQDEMRQDRVAVNELKDTQIKLLDTLKVLTSEKLRDMFNEQFSSHFVGA